MNPLAVAGWIYSALAQTRNQLYLRQWLPRLRLPAPVISIGNLTLGGTGKTPMVLHVADLLTRAGYDPVVLTRGYGRRDRRPHVVAPGQEPVPGVEELGDEPVLIRRREPAAWLGVGNDRHALGLRIASLTPRPVFVLDDGFQHRRLYRDLDILMLDSSQSLVDNRVVPAGSLREPVTGLRRADLILLGEGPSPDRSSVEQAVRSIDPLAQLLHCRQETIGFQAFEAWRRQAEPQGIAVPPAFLVAAIGNPVRFRRSVEREGIEVRGTRFFRDHRRLRPREWEDCAREARERGAGVLITTEKDGVKIADPPEYPLLVSIQNTVVEESERFRARILTLASRKP